MKQTLLLIILVLILTSTSSASTLVTEEADDMQYLVNHSDTIIVGKVVDRDFVSYTIEIEEWLKNPQPTENINVTSFNTDFRQPFMFHQETYNFYIKT